MIGACVFLTDSGVTVFFLFFWFTIYRVARYGTRGKISGGGGAGAGSGWSEVGRSPDAGAEEARGSLEGERGA